MQGMFMNSYLYKHLFHYLMKLMNQMIITHLSYYYLIKLVNYWKIDLLLLRWMNNK